MKAMKFCAEHPELQSDTGTVYPYLIVMPAAEHDLSDLLGHSRIAGTNIDAVVALTREVGVHLQYLHDHGRIHGDFKARNIVKVINDDNTSSWRLIDLDASCNKGCAAADKVTSTTNFPPELARRELAQQDLNISNSDGAEVVIASEQFEMWCHIMNASCR